MEETPAQWKSLGFLALAELLGMTLWFSASAVEPSIRDEWDLSPASAAWLTISVQIGFVAGTFFSALFNLPDIVSSKRLFAVAGLLGAATNGVFALAAVDLSIGLSLRFLTGMFLAGVYPPGLKLAATWSRRHRGVAIGLLVGALAVGSAVPHLIKSLVDIPWREVMIASSVLAVSGSVIVLTLVRDGPFGAPPARFDPRFAFRVLTHRGLRLANIGYLGHQWELYAMWTWVPVFLVQTMETRELSTSLGSMIAFAVIALGGAGSILAGVTADRFGRTLTASGALVASGSMALLLAFLLEAPFLIMLPVMLIWGLTAVADSAQFSASVTELSPPEYVGTALTMQISLGFLVTLFSIQLVPLLVDLQGWRLAFATLALGPAVGVWAMMTLRRLPEAKRLAGGHR